MSLEIGLEANRIQCVVDNIRAEGSSIGSFFDRLLPLFADDKREFVSMLDENVGYVTNLLYKQSPEERRVAIRSNK